jgi:hypothetical protein
MTALQCDGAGPARDSGVMLVEEGSMGVLERAQSCQRERADSGEEGDIDNGVTCCLHPFSCQGQGQHALMCCQDRA